MLKSLSLPVVALAFLAACDAPTPGFTISPDAMARGDSITAQTIAPAVSPNTVISTFDAFCGRFPGNPAGTQRAVEGAGYFLLATGTLDGLSMWASDDGRPLVATGRRDGAEVCMVLMEEGRDLGPAVETYVTRKSGGAAVDFGSMQVGRDTAENVWIIPTQPPVIYFTLVQVQPGLGRVEAFAIVTE